MAKYIKNIKVNGVANLVSTCNDKNIKNITINGVTYTRDFNELDPISLNTRYTDTYMNTVSLTAVDWGTSDNNYGYAQGGYGNFSRANINTGNITLYSNSTGSSSNIKANSITVYSNGRINLTLDCKGPTNTWFNGHVSVQVTSTANFQSDKLGTLIISSLQFPFKSYHTVDRGFGCLLWGDIESPYISPSGVGNPGDVFTPFYNLESAISNAIGSTQTLNQIASGHGSSSGALSYLQSQGYNKGVIVFMPGTIVYLDDIQSIINSGFSVIVLDAPTHEMRIAMQTGTLGSDGEHFIVFLDVSVSSAETFNAMYAFKPDYFETGGIGAILTDPTTVTYINNNNSDWFQSSHFVSSYLTEDATSGSKYGDYKNWNEMIDEWNAMLLTWDSGVAVIDSTYTIYGVNTRRGSSQEKITNVFSNFTAGNGYGLFMSNYGVTSEYDLAALNSEFSYVLMHRKLYEGIAQIVENIKNDIQNVFDGVSSIKDELPDGDTRTLDIYTYSYSPSDTGTDDRVFITKAIPVMFGEGYNSSEVGFDWNGAEDGPF